MKKILEYLKESSFKFRLSLLITSFVRVIGLIIIWSIVINYLDFSWWNITVSVVIGIIYIGLEYADLAYKSVLSFKVLYETPRRNDW